MNSRCGYGRVRRKHAARLAVRAGLAEYKTPWAQGLVAGRMVAMVTSCSRCLQHGYVCDGCVEWPRAVGLEAAKTAFWWFQADSMLSRHALPSYPGLGWSR